MADDGTGHRRQLGRNHSLATMSLADSRDLDNSASHHSFTELPTIIRSDEQGEKATSIENRTGATQIAQLKSLLDGFTLLRLIQLINFDIYHINSLHLERTAPVCDQNGQPQGLRSTVLFNLEKLRLRKSPIELALWLIKCSVGCLKILLSFIAIILSITKTTATIFLCLLIRSDYKTISDHQSDATATSGSSYRPTIASMNVSGPGSTAGAFSKRDEAPSITMGWLVLIAMNLSATFIFFSTVFNGHLLWALLGQKLFFVGRKFQCKTMLSFFIFIPLEYIVNSLLVNNLFSWPFRQSSIGSEDDDLLQQHREFGGLPMHHSHRNYYILTKLEVLVTERDESNAIVNFFLGVLQFARGIIRISPYITINYCIICLKRHIEIIRNQNLLTESLKRKQRLRLVVTSSPRRLRSRSQRGEEPARKLSNLSTGPVPGSEKGKKRVLFAAGSSLSVSPSAEQQASGPSVGSGGEAERRNDLSPAQTGNLGQRQRYSPSLMSLDIRSVSSLSESRLSQLLANSERMCCSSAVAGGGDLEEENKGEEESKRRRSKYSDCVRDFHELESSITKLYIFTGRLNRLMGRVGLTMFFIAHNLLISCTLIVPQAIGDAQDSLARIYFIRALVIFIAMVPFVCGQSLDGQLEQLSKQIDRIIILQKIDSSRRDNLVRTRELLHDIRLNCAGMLVFNVENGIFKYLLVAFASAFFVEQRG